MPPVDQDLVVDRSRRWRALSAITTVVGLAALVGWYASHPAALPVQVDPASASTPVGVPVYVGVADGVENRSLDLAGVKIVTTSNTDVDVTALLCRDGRVDVTSDPAPFCSEIVNPEGQRLTASDSIIVRVVSDAAALAVLDPVRLAFRERLQWDTLPVGRGAVVRVLSR